MEQEPGSSGVNTIDHYRRIVLPGFRFDGNRSTGSKEERFNVFASQAEHGNVYAVMGMWVEPWLTELESFPSKRYKDDQVDATSGGYEFLAKKIRHGRPSVRVVGG
jgi:predicted phage terminase large subunit-like protein